MKNTSNFPQNFCFVCIKLEIRTKERWEVRKTEENCIKWEISMKDRKTGRMVVWWFVHKMTNKNQRMEDWWSKELKTGA